MRPDELALLVAVGRTLLAYIRGAGQLANIEDLYGLREALQPFEPQPQPSLADLEDAVPSKDFDWGALQELRKRSP